ncbi:MAG TPA: hypothetical protein VGM50_18545 [Gemmatimonadaceae bacterium]|jgi:hypothetical protein
MRPRTLVVVAALAVLSLPLDLSAQLRRPPHPTPRGTLAPPEVAPPTPEAPPVAREMAFRRSRWDAGSYAYLNSMQLPTPHGLSTTQSFGAGLHGDYWYTENFAITMDAATSNIGDPANTETFEIGGRYSPIARASSFHPFVDVRGTYMKMYDTFSLPEGAIVGASDFTAVSRYANGLGAVAGAGIEFGLSHSLALTTEILGVRSHMNGHLADAPTTVPIDSRYWMTTARYVIGIRYSRISMPFTQNPRS